MVFKLKCKVCGNVITYDTNSKHDNYQKCGKCEQTINMSIESKLENVANMDGFEVIGIEDSFDSKLLLDDLSCIVKIFDAANSEDQQVIVNIIDKLYLMLNRKDGVTLKEIEKLLKDYFFKSCEKGIEI